MPSNFIDGGLHVQHVAKMRKGESVLIHAAAGGVGSAAVQLALREGAIAFATAGSDAKRSYLHSLGIEHVFDSRSAAFAQKSRSDQRHRRRYRTQLSCRSRWMRPFRDRRTAGVVGIGKRGLWTAERVDALAATLLTPIVDWSDDAIHQPSLIGGILQETMRAAERGGTATPYRTFSMRDTAQAFRFMAKARHGQD